VYSRIASIEAEHPTAQAPAVVAAATAIPVATATVSQTPSQRLTARTPLKSRKKVIRRIRSAITTLLCMGILLVTGYISVDTWLTNQQVKEVVAQKQEAAVKGVALGEGDDETPVAPAVIENYQVAADLPRTLIVQKLGIKARVLPMGVNADGSMQAPVNINDSGWYNASAKPGTKGATVIDAHASGASRHGLFAYLDTLKAGDTLSIEKGDGQLLNYEVTATETVPMNDVDMRKVLTPQGTAEGMNLITCTGTWLPDQKTYNHRVIVYTKRT
jgi:LPXTG-site transpeptidase (sortase) family protein